MRGRAKAYLLEQYKGSSSPSLELGEAIEDYRFGDRDGVFRDARYTLYPPGYSRFGIYRTSYSPGDEERISTTYFGVRIE